MAAPGVWCRWLELAARQDYSRAGLMLGQIRKDGSVKPGPATTEPSSVLYGCQLLGRKWGRLCMQLGEVFRLTDASRPRVH